MKELLTIIGAAVLAVAVVAGLSVGGYYMYAFLAPKYESTRRDVMIQSRQYSEGTVRELYNLKRQYEATANEVERETIAAAARHEFQIFPQERLPGDLRGFMRQVGG
jgi:hypothetical protein